MILLPPCFTNERKCIPGLLGSDKSNGPKEVLGRYIKNV